MVVLERFPDHNCGAIYSYSVPSLSNIHDPPTHRPTQPKRVVLLVPLGLSVHFHTFFAEKTRAASMAAATLIFLLSAILLSSFSISAAAATTDPPTPTPWPQQFHSIVFINYSGSIEIIDLWYDWPNGRNFNIIQKQLGKLVYDLEWNNGTTFYYTLDSTKECRTKQFQVGILRPDWLDGATYLGQQHFDGFLCNVWEKADFLWYHEDVLTKRPVHWLFYTGRHAHVMTFEVGAVLDDVNWQAPVYCFDHPSDHLEYAAHHQSVFHKRDLYTSI